LRLLKDLAATMDAGHFTNITTLESFYCLVRMCCGLSEIAANRIFLLYYRSDKPDGLIGPVRAQFARCGLAAELLRNLPHILTENGLQPLSHCKVAISGGKVVIGLCNEY
jgi:hypothetical protein